ncbi:MAG: ABC transporter substrate-binding protein, partial [Halanaerobiales bacterium]
MLKKYFTILLTFIFVFGLAGMTSAQTYRIGIGEDPTTMNYWASLGPGESSMYNFTVMEGYYSALFGLTYPSYTVTPGLAADDPAEFEKEGDYYTSVVPLRKGLKWSDGNEFTADDVVFTYNTIMDLKLEGNWAQYRPDIMKKVEKVDDYHVKFYFEEVPGLGHWTYGVLNCGILSKAEWESTVEVAKTRDDPAQYLYSYQVEEPVTIGGMEFGKWEKGSFWQNDSNQQNEGVSYKIYESGRHELEAGDWSWAGLGEEADELTVEYKEGPYIDNAVYRLFSNQEAMVMALKRGDIDYILSAQGLTEGFRKELESASDVNMASNPSNGFRMLAFNRTQYPFDIYEFHQAIDTLVDRDYVMNTVLQGAGVPLATFVPPGNEFWHNPDVSSWGEGLSRVERIAQAVELLEEAGFTWEQKPEVDLEEETYEAGSGIIAPNGEKVEQFDILTPTGGYDPFRSTFGLWIQNWLSDVGIPARSKPTQFNVILDQVFSRGEFDAFILGWGLEGAFP